MREPLLFSGIRWPAAQGSSPANRSSTATSIPAEEGALGRHAHHRDQRPGRPYEVNFAEGWWRDLAELPLDDEKRVLSFLQRRGDPFGVLAPGGKQISTYDWRDLKSGARTGGGGMGSATGRGPACRTSARRSAAAQSACSIWRLGPKPRPDGPMNLGVTIRGITPIHRAKTLAAYMCAAAAASVRGGPGYAPLRLLQLVVHPPLRQRPPVLGLMPCRPLQQTEIAPWLRFARSQHVRERSGGRAGGGCRERTAACRTARRTSRPGRKRRRTPRRCARSNAAASATRTDMISPATCAAWLAHHRERGDLAPTTMRGYERNAALASRYCGHVLLEKLSARDLDALYAKLLTHGSQPKGPPRPLSRQSVMHVHRLLHAALRQAVKWRLIAHNPAADATPPSVPHKQARGFTIEEITALLAAAEADPETYCMLALLLTTGLRRSELLGLTLDALDLEAATLTVAAHRHRDRDRGGRPRDHQDQVCRAARWPSRPRWWRCCAPRRRACWNRRWRGAASTPPARGSCSRSTVASPCARST